MVSIPSHLQHFFVINSSLSSHQMPSNFPCISSHWTHTCSLALYHIVGFSQLHPSQLNDFHISIISISNLFHRSSCLFVWTTHAWWITPSSLRLAQVLATEQLWILSTMSREISTLPFSFSTFPYTLLFSSTVPLHLFYILDCSSSWFLPEVSCLSWVKLYDFYQL